MACARGYADDDADGYPGPRCATDDEFGLSHVLGFDCDDADATIHPGADEICGDATDDDCDDEPLPCDWPSEGMVATSGFEVAGQEENEWIGSTLGRVDLPGTGAPVVAVASLLHNYENEGVWQGKDGIHGQGKVWFFDAGGTFALDDAIATIEPPTGACAREVWADVGDLTGDGVGDAFVLWGSLEARQLGFALFAGPFAGEVPFDSNAAILFADDPVSAGDWNGDGSADVAASLSPNQVGVWTGPWSRDIGEDGAELMLVPGDDAEPFQPARARDLDGDGRPDLAVAAANWEGPDVAGLVALVPAGITGTIPLADAAAATVRGTVAYEYLGAMGLSPAGDLDGDGYEDLLAMCALYGEAQPYGGFVLFGPFVGESTALDHSAAFLYSDPSFSGPGDFDGDGQDDLALGGFYGLAPSGNGAGAIEIFEGPLAEGTYDLTTVRGDVVLWAPDGVGVGAATPMGDLDGDGRADLAIQATDDDPIKGAGGVYFVFGGAL